MSTYTDEFVRTQTRTVLLYTRLLIVSLLTIEHFIIRVVYSHSVVPTMSITITIPDSVMTSAQMSEEEIKQEIAIALYQQSKLTLSQARRLAEMSRHEFKRLLISRKISLYDVADYQEDLETLRSLGRL